MYKSPRGEIYRSEEYGMRMVYLEGMALRHKFFLQPYVVGCKTLWKPKGTRDLITILGEHLGFAFTFRPDARRISTLGEVLGLF